MSKTQVAIDSKTIASLAVLLLRRAEAARLEMAKNANAEYFAGKRDAYHGVASVLQALLVGDLASLEDAANAIE